MIVEVDIKDYYKAFIDNANSDIEKYQEARNTNYDILKSTKEYINKFILFSTSLCATLRQTKSTEESRTNGFTASSMIQ